MRTLCDGPWLAVLLLTSACATAPASPPSTAPAPTATSTAPASPGGPAPEILARIGEETITVEDFRLEMARRGGRLPGQYATVEQRHALLDEMVRTRIALVKARAEGLDKDPEYRATVERLLTSQYLRARLEPELEKISVTQEEVASFYAAHRQEFMTPARLRAAWIFLAVSAKADEAQVEKARARLLEARAEALKLPPETRNLGDVARRYSEDSATRYTGGELGWLYAEQAEAYRWGPELVKAAFSLTAPGEVTDVLRHERGLYILKLVEREEATPTPLEKLAGGIRSRLLTERREAARAQFFAALLTGTKITVDEAKLGAIQPLSGEKKPAAPPPALPRD